MQIQCYTIDDEPLAVELIESYIRRIPFLSCAGSFNNGIDAFAALKHNPVPLIFMDIHMPYISGLELAKIIDTYQTRVIFTTAYPQYALDGYRVNALDYLLKPIRFDQFLSSAERARKHILEIQTTGAGGLNGSITIKADYKLHRLDFQEILYIESLRDYVCFHLKNGQKIQTLSTMKNMESQLPPTLFARIHRSFMVNLRLAESIERGHILIQNHKLPISDAYKDDVLVRFGKENR